MKYLYLIRHAKSSWQDTSLKDYDRPLKNRGKNDVAIMAERLRVEGIKFDLMVSSPAKRARSTARKIAKGTGYRKKDIVYTKDLYLSSVSKYRDAINDYFRQADVLAIVGHNEVITECAELLTRENIGNIPTCGIVVIEYSGDFTSKSRGKLKSFDFPKNNKRTLINK
ncbi:MAG: histidine phosphatase family protein [Desulfotalea sp.]